MLELYEIERRFNFVGRDIRTLGMHTTKIMKSSFTHQNRKKKKNREKEQDDNNESWCPSVEPQINRKHVSMLPTARSRWKTLVWLANKWPSNPPDKPSFQWQVLLFPLRVWQPCSAADVALHRSQVCIPRKNADPLTFASKTSKYFTGSQLYFLLFLMNLIQTWS